MKRKLIIFGLFSIFFVFPFSGTVRAEIPEQGGDFPQNVCKNLWWRDGTHPNCSQKEFCAMYMYRGLLTFETKAACQSMMDDQSPPVTISPKDVAVSWPKRILLQVQEFFASILARFFPSIQNGRQEIPTKEGPTGEQPVYNCGGFMGTRCPSGYKCKILGGDAGTCVRSGLFGF